MARRARLPAGWQPGRLLESVPVPGRAEDQCRPIPHDEGNGLAVWSRSNGAIRNLWANRHTTGAGWGTEGRLESDNGSTAVAVWTRFDGTHDKVVAAVHR